MTGAMIPTSAKADRLPTAIAAVAPLLTQADRAAWIAILPAAMLKAGITGARRIAAFLGQCAVESGGFRDLEENLSYSPARLCQVWPDRFPTLTAAQPFAYQPEKLANTVYADRMGNGDAASGDGWCFRGRGLIQLSGRAAYQRFATAIGQSLTDATQFAATLAGSAESAVGFWTDQDLNPLADAWEITRITERVNGGLTDVEVRINLSNAALRGLSA
jgi:putative chitinase